MSIATPSGIADGPLKAELRRLSRPYGLVVALSCVIPIFYLVTPIFMMQVAERVLTSHNETTLFFLLAICLFMIAIWAAVDEARRETLRRVGLVLDERVSRRVFEALHRNGKGNRNDSSFIVLNDINLVRDVLSGPIVISIIDSLWAPLLIVALYFIHPVYSALAILLLVLNTVVSVAGFLVGRNGARRAQEAQIQETEFGVATARAVEASRGLGMVPRLRDRWYQIHRAMLGWQSAVASRSMPLAAIGRALRQAENIVVIAIGVHLYFKQEVNVGAVFSTMIILSRGLAPVEAVIGSWRGIYSGLLAYRRVDAALRVIEGIETRLPLPAPEGRLEVNRVFATAPGREALVLNDVSFVLEKGRVLGIVGPSGAGKSVLARLLAGIWQPTRGNVSLDAHDLTHWDEDQLGKHLGYMPQDVELLPGTLAENIARFDPALTESSEGVLRAVEIAGISDLVRSLPNGYNTRVGPKGHVLSGGQRQRVALARAVYGDPRLVVLDEPNSNLDATGEKALGDAIDHLKAKGVTVVVVTHKVNLLVYCDDILVLNAGSVQSFGSREQILNRVTRMQRPVPTLAYSAGTSGV